MDDAIQCDIIISDHVRATPFRDRLVVHHQKLLQVLIHKQFNQIEVNFFPILFK